MRAIPLLLLLAALIAAAPSTAGAVTKAERKAVDIKAVDGASTATSAYVEVSFRGQMEDMLGTKGLRRTKVKVKFIPETGKATTIIESGRSIAPNTRRRGTKGFSEVLRAGRTLAVLVRGLPAAAGEVVVTAGKLDKQRAELRALENESQLDAELERTDRSLTRLWAARTGADYRAFATMDRIERADSRKKRRKQQAKLAQLNELRGALAARIELLGSWIKILDKAVSGLAKRECNDGVDGSDPEDSIADFGSDKDPGCVMPLDNDEGDAPLTITCPSPGTGTSVSAMVTIPQPNELERFILSLPPLESDEPRRSIVDAPVTSTSGGPYPLDTGVTQLCNYEFDFVYSYAVVTSGMPPGTFGLRVTVSVQNNGGFAGGAQIPFRLAAGTTR